ncbi:hypothetical protein C1H46_002733 [Malus baccata]|uniref:TFIIS central domain-containing protein n=1 Tax=Malus baccata TaxID=106549 RepID=A0A540NKX9_MALBA|nr:hypothetical protein C1H46_002733 [Malus baccata]
MASGSRFRFKTSLSKPESDEPRYAPESCYLGAGPDAPVSVCITENPNFQNWRETGLPPILPGADVPWWQAASLPVGPQPSLADALYDEKTERLSVRRMIAGALSRVSKEVGESFRDSVNAFDPRKVAAQVESVLFDNWGFRDESNYDKYEAIIHFLILDEIKEFRRQVLVGEIPPEMLLNMSFEQLQQRYPQTRSYLDYVAPK